MYSRTSEPVKFERNCAAVMVPSGEAVELPAGSVGYITQALGGAFTVYVEGNLFRIAGHDADAIGKTPLPLPTLAEGASDAEVEALVWDQLRTCFDPEIPVNIVELGLVYECNLFRLDDGHRRAEIKMTLTAPGCGMGEVIANEVNEKVLNLPRVEECTVNIVFDPPWDRSMMTEEAKLALGL